MTQKSILRIRHDSAFVIAHERDAFVLALLNYLMSPSTKSADALISFGVVVQHSGDTSSKDTWLDGLAKVVRQNQGMRVPQGVKEFARPFIGETDDEVCAACFRPSLECSRNPCPAVWEDRDEPEHIGADGKTPGCRGCRRQCCDCSASPFRKAGKV